MVAGNDLPDRVIFIPGVPVAQGRPRFTTRNGKPRAIDPARSRGWKIMAGHLMKIAMGSPPLHGPIELRMEATWPLPASQQRKRSVPSKTRRVSRPDLENVLKCWMDAATGIVYRDDSQVVRVIAEKWTAGQGDLVGVRVEVRELRGEGE